MIPKALLHNIISGKRMIDKLSRGIIPCFRSVSKGAWIEKTQVE
jgi:hypothetical protein